LTPATNYSFSITASDLAGNKAANNPIVLSATTAANTNTDCAGTASEASQGSFSVGYKYGFVTTGTDVAISFELLDDKTGVVAYVWNYTSAFAETIMTNVSGKKFTKTLTGQTIGSVIKIACKFAYAGGMVVTKQFSYTVGNKCDGTAVESVISKDTYLYPNPVQDKLHLNSERIISQVIIRNLLGQTIQSVNVNNSETTLDMSQISAGNYFVTLKLDDGRITTQKIVKL
jgi:hypothetical protein